MSVLLPPGDCGVVAVCVPAGELAPGGAVVVGESGVPPAAGVFGTMEVPPGLAGGAPPGGVSGAIETPPGANGTGGRRVLTPPV